VEDILIDAAPDDFRRDRVPWVFIVILCPPREVFALPIISGELATWLHVQAGRARLGGAARSSQHTHPHERTSDDTTH